MTEKTGNYVEPRFGAARYSIDPVAFFAALFAAPILVAVAGFWLFFVPVGALLVGYVPYLIIGMPVLMVLLAQSEGTAPVIAKTAFFTMAAVLGVALAVVALNAHDPWREVSRLLGMCMLCLVFASIWGGTFGVLYNRWRSDASRQPLPPLA